MPLDPHVSCLERAAADPAASPAGAARLLRMAEIARDVAGDPTRNEEEENRDDA
jgi:hypothetical protein